MARSQGFTLIELTIVVAIIGIMAATAIPQYQDYVVRSRLGKVAAAVTPIKTAIAEYALLNGTFDVTLDNWTGSPAAQGLGLSGPPTPTAEIVNYSLAANTGILTVTLAANGIGSCANGQTIQWLPAISPTHVRWTVTGSFPANSICQTELTKWQ